MTSPKRTFPDSAEEIKQSISKPLLPQRRSDSKSRALSIGCYFGFAPWIWFTGVYKKTNILSHHLFYSLSLFLLSACWFMFSLVLNFRHFITYEYFLSLNAGVRVMRAWNSFIYWGDIVEIPVFVVLIAIWITSIMGGLRGEARQIPILAKMARSRWLMSFSAFVVVFAEICMLCLFYIGIRSAQIVNTPVEKADVYILYTVGGYYAAGGTLNTTYTPPSWAVAIAFYPLLSAGIEKWGKTSVKVEPLSEESFKEAINHGRFVFVASHGGNPPGGFTVSYTPYKSLIPSDILPSEAGSNLQYVYLAGCETNAPGANWQTTLSSAEVMSFNRTIYVDEHLLWIWLKSPAVIAKLQ